jgi:hypothetical protein
MTMLYKPNISGFYAIPNLHIPYLYSLYHKMNDYTFTKQDLTYAAHFSLSGLNLSYR